MKLSWRVLVLLLLLIAGPLLSNITSAFAQDQPRKWKKALPGYKFTFPRDHASHDEFKTEWWYFTGHLESADGRKFGYELTFFRIGADANDLSIAGVQPSGSKVPSIINSKWMIDNFYSAHFALTDIQNKKFYFFEKLNRKGLGLADARTDSCFVFNERWSLSMLGDSFVIKADDKDLSLNLLLKSKKPPVIHGKDGVSQKATGSGRASHYYSMTRLLTDGVLIDHGKALKVKGSSWMDHEFGSNQLGADQVGWDWFSIQLNDGRELMLYLLRKSDGSIDSNSAGTLIGRDGQTTHLKSNEFTVSPVGHWKSPQSGGNYPMGWRIGVTVPRSGIQNGVTVPRAGIQNGVTSPTTGTPTPAVAGELLTLTLNPLLNDQELRTTRSTGVTYWEGAVDVKGNSQLAGGKKIDLSGQGYVEMTGYSERLRQKI